MDPFWYYVKARLEAQRESVVKKLDNELESSFHGLVRVSDVSEKFHNSWTLLYIHIPISCIMCLSWQDLFGLDIMIILYTGRSNH
jgi:hypothetical protein